jgi:hypothetical protein
MTQLNNLINISSSKRARNTKLVQRLGLFETEVRTDWELDANNLVHQEKR